MSFSEWRSTTLGEITRIKGGKRLPKGILLTTEKNDHPYIRIRNLGSSKNINLNSDFEFVDDETFSKISRYIVNQDDVILSIVGTIGLVGKIGKTLDNASLTENCIKFVNLTNINRDFLYYFLVSKYGQDEIKKMTVGAVQPKLPIKNIEKIEIKLPLLDEQFRISSILNSLEEKIELNNRINKTLEEMAQAVFKSWFVDFAPFKDEEFIESEIGLIPINWSIFKIREKIETILGGTPSRKIPEYWNGDIPWINSGKVNEFRIIQASEFISDSGLKKSATKLLPKKTTVIAITGATLGQVSLIEIDACANQSVIGLIQSDEIKFTYIYPYIKTNIESLTNLQTGGAQQHINKTDVDNFNILVPSQSVLDRYNMIVEPLFECIALNCFENQKLSTIKDQLLPKLMSGEIRVPIEEETYAEVC